jgi:hypothetical protein
MLIAEDQTNNNTNTKQIIKKLRQIT